MKRYNRPITILPTIHEESSIPSANMDQGESLTTVISSTEMDQGESLTTVTTSNEFCSNCKQIAETLSKMYTLLITFTIINVSLLSILFFFGLTLIIHVILQLL